MGRVLAAEHTEFKVTCLDLSPLESEGEVTQLVRELFQGKEEMVAFREGQRYTARLVRPSYRENPKRLEIHREAAYLITGGLGALGLVQARWLAERGAGYIVLTGRKAPDEATRRKLEELGRSGATIKVATVDVTDQAALSELLKELPLPL